MLGLPEKFDYSPFFGRDLESVSFSENNVHFSFGVGCSVTTDASYSYRIRDGQDLICERVPTPHSSVMQLSGRTVLDVHQEGKGTLVLVLDGGALLLFHEEEVPFECYRFVCGGKEVFV